MRCSNLHYASVEPLSNLVPSVHSVHVVPPLHAALSVTDQLTLCPFPLSSSQTLGPLQMAPTCLSCLSCLPPRHTCPEEGSGSWSLSAPVVPSAPHSSSTGELRPEEWEAQLIAFDIVLSGKEGEMLDMRMWEQWYRCFCQGRHIELCGCRHILTVRPTFMLT